jgi:hypothetical protein
VGFSTRGHDLEMRGKREVAAALRASVRGWLTAVLRAKDRRVSEPYEERRAAVGATQRPRTTDALPVVLVVSGRSDGFPFGLAAERYVGTPRSESERPRHASIAHRMRMHVGVHSGHANICTLR